MRRGVLSVVRPALVNAAAPTPAPAFAPPRGQLRWNVFDAMSEMSSKRHNERTKVRTDMRTLVKEAEEKVKASLVMGKDIPKKYTTFVVTHIGDMDGEDQPCDEPVRLSRKEALAFAERDGHDLCFVEANADGEAVCRLRYSKMFIRKMVHEATVGEKRSLQTRLSDVGAKFPSNEVQIKLRSTIEKTEMREKVAEAARALAAGRSVRFIFRLFVSEEHLEPFIKGTLDIFKDACERHGVEFRAAETTVAKKGGHVICHRK